MIQTKEATFKRYPAYKDSGVDWLGEIPRDWAVFPLFALTKLKSISNCPSLELLSVYLELGVIRFEDVKAKRTNVTSLDLSKYQKVEPGDFVLNNQQAWRGSVGVSNYKGIVSPAYLVLSLSDKLNPTFAHYYFRNGAMVGQYLISSKGVGTIQRNLYWPELRTTYISLPPFPEQTAIANFLDNKTAKIDTTIAQKEKMIALLKERKQIIIQNAVTGKWSMVNGEWSITPKDKLRDSGVEWIGEIPEGWEVKKLKHCLKSISEKIISKDSNFIYLGMENIESRTGKRIVSETEAEGLSNKFEIGDILFGKLRPYLAKVFLSDFEGICSTEFIVFRTQQPQYFHKLLLSDAFINLIDSSTYGAKMPRANGNWIAEQIIPAPQKEEQSVISIHIETQSAKIDQSITLQQTQIEKLKEYKATLIDSAVTGKIRVDGG